MQTITVKKQGLFFSVWDKDATDWVERNILDETQPISLYFPYQVIVSEDITVREFLTLLRPHADVLQLAFANALDGILLNEIYEILETKKPKGQLPNMDAIFCFNMGEAIPIQGDDLPLFSFYPVVMGTHTKADEDSDDYAHRLSTFDIRDWCDFPMIVDSYMEVIDVRQEDVMISGYMDWKFSTLIHAILSQITISLRVTKTVSSSNVKASEGGPITVSELMGWIDEFDRILHI